MQVYKNTSRHVFIVAMTDSTEAKVNTYAYDTVVASNEQSGLNNPWKFAGGFLDSSTGLYKYGIRYDDPTIGRWTQRMLVGGSLQEMLVKGWSLCRNQEGIIGYSFSYASCSS